MSVNYPLLFFLSIGEKKLSKLEKKDVTRVSKNYENMALISSLKPE